MSFPSCFLVLTCFCFPTRFTHSLHIVQITDVLLLRAIIMHAFEPQTTLHTDWLSSLFSLRIVKWFSSTSSNAPVGSTDTNELLPLIWGWVFGDWQRAPSLFYFINPSPCFCCFLTRSPSLFVSQRAAVSPSVIVFLCSPDNSFSF